jgi:hypothetical protein
MEQVKRITSHHNRIGAFPHHPRKRAVEFAGTVGLDKNHLYPQRLRHDFRLFDVGRMGTALRGIFAGCCAGAARGAATTAPPSVAMNSRRLMWMTM